MSEENKMKVSIRGDLAGVIAKHLLTTEFGEDSDTDLDGERVLEIAATLMFMYLGVLKANGVSVTTAENLTNEFVENLWGKVDSLNSGVEVTG